MEEKKHIDPRLVRLGDIVQEYDPVQKRMKMPMSVCGIFTDKFSGDVTLYLNFPQNDGDMFEARAIDCYPVEIDDDTIKLIGGVEEGKYWKVALDEDTKLFIEQRDRLLGVHCAYASYEDVNVGDFVFEHLHDIQHDIYEELKFEINMK